MFKWLSRKMKDGSEGRQDGDSSAHPTPTPPILKGNPASAQGATPPAIPGQGPPLSLKTAEQSPPSLQCSPTPMPKPMSLGEGMPGKCTGPENDLERVLLAFRQRQIPVQDFLESLFNAQVFILPKQADLARDGARIKLVADPHLFSITYPEYVALAIYTSHVRIQPTKDQYPEFRLAVEVHAGQFLSGLASRCGLVINPYWDINIEWNADQMDRIKQMMRCS